MKERIRRWMPVCLVAALGVLVAFAGLQACGDDSTSGDLSGNHDQSAVADLQVQHDLTSVDSAGSLLQKRTAACANVCACLITSLSVSTCTAACVNDTVNSFSSVLGTTMTAACYDCLTAASCPNLMAGSCFTSTTCQ